MKHLRKLYLRVIRRLHRRNSRLSARERYYSLYRELFMTYVGKCNNSFDAKQNADGAFITLTGLDPDRLLNDVWEENQCEMWGKSC